MTLDKGKIKRPDIDRRKVVIGTAWSIPAIAIAAATPAVAASLTPIVVTPATGTVITNWRGHHHDGSLHHHPDHRSYDFPVTVTDAHGAPIVGAPVTVTVAGQTKHGDILGIYPYPAPWNLGPDWTESRSATVVTGADGVALFGVNTQHLDHHEMPATATLTVTATYNGTTTVNVITAILTASD